MSHLDQIDIATIKRVIKLSKNVDLDLLDEVEQNELSFKSRVHLIDILSECFTAYGLDTDDEPNDFGLKIEAVIDKLN